ncbi:MAG: RluA family pseudouridine synthase [Oscillospiraceae bacterium]|jgi:23S rRNA pseudouridine1911/1915/1917 synthase|nr:RluA family pseudouridine synthase [Oscillospiraceae bacterium]
MPLWTRIVDAGAAAPVRPRIDVYLASVGPLSRSAIERLIVQDRVTVDGLTARKKHRVSAGEVIVVDEPEPAPSEALPEDIPLTVVYEDGDLLVIDKPRGLVVHPAPGHESGTLVNALLAYCGDSLSGIGGVKRPGIVHRLDKDTSGLMVIAKCDMAHTALSAALKKREVTRVYEALARGNIRQETFSIRAPLGRHPIDRKKQAVLPDGREAVTHGRVLVRYNGYTHIECRLETGRTHQIRVHMSHIGHPLAGDTRYGGKPGELGLDAQCLHARELAFIHPRKGRELRFFSKLPDYFLKTLAMAGTGNI